MIEFKVIKYSKAPEDLTAPATCGTKQRICKTCDHALKQENCQLKLKPIEDTPPELSD